MANGTHSLKAPCGEGWILSQRGVIAGLLVAPRLRTNVNPVMCSKNLPYVCEFLLVVSFMGFS